MGIGQELQKQALSAINEKVQDVSEKALNKIQLPESVKNAARSELGQQLQNKIISEVGNTVQQIAPGSRKRARNITKTAFEKNGLKYPDWRKLSEGCTSSAKAAEGTTESEKNPAEQS